jgi:hypothetical protein
MRSQTLNINPASVGTAGKWLGRLTALLLLLIWGVFFVEHFFEWFLHPSGELPPAAVWLSQVFHLAIVVGLALMIKWDKLGAVVTVAATTAFLASIAARGTPLVVMINLLPIACFAVSWLNARHRSS